MARILKWSLTLPAWTMISDVPASRSETTGKYLASENRLSTKADRSKGERRRNGVNFGNKPRTDLTGRADGVKSFGRIYDARHRDRASAHCPLAVRSRAELTRCLYNRRTESFYLRLFNSAENRPALRRWSYRISQDTHIINAKCFYPLLPFLP